MVKKRKNSGKNRTGEDYQIQCSKCGCMVARSKAKKVSRPVSLMEGVIAKELREQGAILPNARNTQYLCVSCAIHTHAVNIRPDYERKKRGSLN